MALSATSDGPIPDTWQNIVRPLLLRPSSDNALLIWTHVRAHVIAPVVDAAVVLCMVMSFMLLLEAMFMSAVSLYVVLFRRTPEKRYEWEAMGGDAEKGGSDYPLVLVQIPMYNEKEVYHLSIRAACALTWPPDRIIIQILDDSTDPLVKNLVKVECEEWAKKGINIKYEVRSNRKGYKAGALKKGMEHHYAQQCDFVAIFDADFQPDSDFLLKTIPFLVHNPEIALVQTRWDFVNYSASMMTRIQKMSLDYHFKVEQESGSTTFSFFGFNGMDKFNIKRITMLQPTLLRLAADAKLSLGVVDESGTAGVWRISAINEAGGWQDRTTVEDMDLAVRATLKGWKFLYVGDIRVKSELPSTLKAYRNQQHRWTCGAVYLFRKMGWDIVINKEVSLLKKIHVLYSFFFVRRVIAPIVTFCFYCVVIPISVLIPEVDIPVWGLVYIPTTITILNAIRNPSSLHLMPFWILFENVMAMHRMKAAMVGLLGTSSVNQWVVTEKKGQLIRDKADLEVPLLEPAPTKCSERVYVLELGLAVFLILCATYNIIFGNNHYNVYIYFQAVAFTIVGFGFIGAPNPTS